MYSQYNTPVICTHIMHKNHVPVFDYSYIIYVIVYIQVINIMHLYNNNYYDSWIICVCSLLYIILRCCLEIEG